MQCESNTMSLMFTCFKQEKINYKTLKKTRKFVLDGQVVKITTSKIVQDGVEDKVKKQHLER